MNPILLRNDGPIENDIKPYCLDGKDIKMALEDINDYSQGTAPSIA